MNPSSDIDRLVNLQQLVSSLLAEHTYGVCELAQVCAQRLHEPLCEIITPLADSLGSMVDRGQVYYDRQQNRVALA